MGMFGMSPEMLQQALRTQDKVDALQFAKLDPFQQANYSIYQGAQAGGRMLGEAMGGVDPRIEQAKQIQDLSRSVYASGADPSDPAKFFPAMIKEAQARGMTSLVMPLMKQYQDTMDKIATAEYHKAMADKVRQGYEYKQDYLGRTMVFKDGKPIGFYSAKDFPNAPAVPTTTVNPSKPEDKTKKSGDRNWDKAYD